MVGAAARSRHSPSNALHGRACGSGATSAALRLRLNKPTRCWTQGRRQGGNPWSKPSFRVAVVIRCTMIEFNDLVHALAQWRLTNGQATSAPLATQPEQAIGAAPPPAGRSRPTAPPPMRSKATSIPPPPPTTDLNEFSDVPEDAIEEDGADFEMSFGGPPPHAPVAEEFAEVPQEAVLDAEPVQPELTTSRGITDSFGDGESTVVGGHDRDGNNN